MESILGADQTIATLCEDIIKHYEENRQHELTGKAMIVAYSRPIAMKIYHKGAPVAPQLDRKARRCDLHRATHDQEWREIIGNKRHKDALAKKFKDNDSELKIAIVVDMWLTGFDVPSLATMYVTASRWRDTTSCRPSRASTAFRRVKRAAWWLIMSASRPR